MYVVLLPLKTIGWGKYIVRFESDGWFSEAWTSVNPFWRETKAVISSLSKATRLY